ncbi:MAG: hypothetical protein P1V97_23345 [Planctomycetota bacterium]|nr:hypothetical protein [Planctomycetota bacterium]
MELKGELHFLCLACKAEFSSYEMHEQGVESGVCPSCNTEDWFMYGFFSGSKTNYHIAENVLGIALLATVGVGFAKATNTTETQCVFQEQVTGEEVLKLTRSEWNRRAQLIAQICKKNNERYLEVLQRLNATASVNCFLCHDLFLPGHIKAKNGLVLPDHFTSDKYCSMGCLKQVRDKEREQNCAQCSKAFLAPEAPDDPVMARYWKPRLWHTEGYCSEKCSNGATELGCHVCKKSFVVTKLSYLPIHAKIIEAQKAGYCGIRCQDSGVKLAEYGNDPEASAKEDTENMVQTCCKQEHSFDVPLAHDGLLAFCIDCEDRVKIELSEGTVL